ncbi:hypothetical protein KIPB_006012 [Kipferlia bialata]|uniref:Nudix hydrolase domain-containing protein n=1 Tax=Kipferlia bialata TaxID=797122 RepID=A0A9K3CWK9_9EUKA|nr:hypothetical protein KIPB_006012 [Kipferlia bialata]|eukprot:g6012.t1
MYSSVDHVLFCLVDADQVDAAMHLNKEEVSHTTWASVDDVAELRQQGALSHWFMYIWDALSLQDRLANTQGDGSPLTPSGIHDMSLGGDAAIVGCD